jgi:hypothetical protein
MIQRILGFVALQAEVATTRLRTTEPRNTRLDLPFDIAILPLFSDRVIKLSDHLIRQRPELRMEHLDT